jgi:hypothetical protein
MKIRETARIVPMLVPILILAGVSAAQDAPLGDVARAARAEKSQAPHASKVLTNEDFGPHLEPVHENEDPADVVNKARAAVLADTAHTCRREITGNSGPGASAEIVTEIAGDRAHMVVSRVGGPGPKRDELIWIGNDGYSRRDDGPWQKNPSAGSFPTSIGGLPEDMQMGDGSGEKLKLVRRETIEGSPTFLYETRFHPPGVTADDRTIDIWIGANDHLPRKVQMSDVATAPRPPGFIDRETTTWSYGSVPDIKPPR